MTSGYYKCGEIQSWRLALFSIGTTALLIWLMNNVIDSSPNIIGVLH